MFRLIAYLILTIFVITLIRNVIGFLMRAFANAIQASSRKDSTAFKQTAVPLSGELKKDPVCGTYTAAATSLHETVRGETFYFCSQQCRDKFALRS